MKKLFLGVTAIILVANCLKAQDDRKLRLAFAIQPASSWIVPKGDNLEKDGARIAFSYGILTDIRLGDNANYAFSTGLLVNSQGGTLTNTQFHDGTTTVNASTDSLYDIFTTAQEKYKMQYLDIPLTLKLKTNEIGYMTYYGQFGLDLSINISAKKNLEYQFPDRKNVSEEKIDALKEIQLFRAALQVGAGVEYNISGTTYLMAGVVWNNGLTNIFSRDYIATNEDGTPRLLSDDTKLATGNKVFAKNNYLGLTIAVVF